MIFRHTRFQKHFENKKARPSNETKIAGGGRGALPRAGFRQTRGSLCTLSSTPPARHAPTQKRIILVRIIGLELGLELELAKRKVISQLRTRSGPGTVAKVGEHRKKSNSRRREAQKRFRKKSGSARRATVSAAAGRPNFHFLHPRGV